MFHVSFKRLGWRSDGSGQVFLTKRRLESQMLVVHVSDTVSST